MKIWSHFTLLAYTLLILTPASDVIAESENRQPSQEESLDESKSGFESGSQPLGGPSSTGAQLLEDDRISKPAWRFPKIDEAFKPWFNWKRAINEKYGLQLGVDYNLLYQSASASLSDNKEAASGALRLFGRWTPVGRGTKDTGTLVFKVENRHKIGTDIPPSALGFEVGYNGIPGLLFSDAGTILADLNWQQFFNDGRGGFILGRYDPNDYMDVLGYSNPWTTFSNLSILVNTSIALPDSGLGAGIAYSFDDHWMLRGSVSDANALVTETKAFAKGSELFSFVQMDWTPAIDNRYTHNVHVTAWHVDEREDAAVPESEGISFGANWTYNETTMPFLRMGWSRGGAPLMNKTVTLGFLQRFHHSDLMGVGFNWGDPSNDNLREQYTAELFYRWQFSQNLALTPSIQWLKDPALNPDDDRIWIAGIRMRLSL